MKGVSVQYRQAERFSAFQLTMEHMSDLNLWPGWLLYQPFCRSTDGDGNPRILIDVRDISDLIRVNVNDWVVLDHGCNDIHCYTPEEFAKVFTEAKE